MLTQLVLPALVAMAILQLLLAGLAHLLGRPLDRYAITAGLVLPWVLLAPWVDPGKVLAPSAVLQQFLPLPGEVPAASAHELLNDAVFQFLPWEVEVRRALAAGRLPLWSDLLEGGSSPWVNPQAQVLSPIAVLARAAPLQHFLLVGLLLKVLVACQGTWVLARRLGCHSPAALLAGASYALGGGILAWALFPHTSTAAWAPWVVAGTLAVARGGRRAAMIGLALATAALMLSGHPEIAVATVCLAALVAVALRRRRRGSLVHVVGACAIAGSLGIGLAAPHLLPFALATRHSLRAGERLETPVPPLVPGPHQEWFVGGGARFFRGPWSPLAFGPPYGPVFGGPWAWPLALSAYTGMVAAAGGLAALAGRGRRRALPLLLFTGVALLLASRFTPLEAVLFRFPPLRVPELSRFLPIGSLALAAAAGLGWETLRRRRSGPLLLAAAALAAAAAVVVSPLPVVAGLALLIVGAAAVVRRHPRLGLAIAAAALLLDLVPWGRAQLPADPAHTFYPALPALTAIAEEVAQGPWRATGHDYTLYASLLPVYGIAEVRPHNPLADRDQLLALESAFGFSPDSAEYFSPLGNVGHPLLDFLNVRILATSAPLPPATGFEELPHLRSPRLRFYRNHEALPRWFVPARVRVVPRERLAAEIAAMRDAREVLVATEDVGPEVAATWEPSVAVATESQRPGRVVLAVGGSGKRLVATSLPGPRGWRARAAGKRLETLQVNGGFLGVRVPAGVHRIELSYRPLGIDGGALVTLLAVLGLFAIALPFCRRFSRRP